MAKTNFTETVADTAAKLRASAGRMQRLASQLERIQRLDLPVEAKTQIVGFIEGLRSSLNPEVFDEAIDSLRQINEALGQ
jgi:hypothetical protein